MAGFQDDPVETARVEAFLLSQRVRRSAERARLNALSGSRIARHELALKFRAVVANPDDRRETTRG